MRWSPRSDAAAAAAIEHLYLTEPIADLGRIDGIMFSGGVGEYVYGREERDFGDMGRRLGGAVRRAARRRRAALAAAAGRRMHPRHRARRLRIQRAALRQHQLHLDPGRAAAAAQSAGAAAAVSSASEVDRRREALAAAIRATSPPSTVADGEREVALALRWHGAPSLRAHLRVRARASRAASPAPIANGQPLFIMLDGDVAQTLGAILREELEVESEILVIDGVVLWDFDYIDLGRIRLPSNTVPVTIKSLVFSEDPRRPHIP